MIDYFPQSPDFIDAVLTYYELLINDKDYANALTTIRKVEDRSDETFYYLILNKIAFAYFYLNQIPQAITYLHRELSTLPPFPEKAIDEKAATVEFSDRERALTNCILFYFTGITRKIPEYTVPGSVAFIKSLQPGPATEKLLTYLIKLFRSTGMDPEIETFKKLVFEGFGKDSVLVDCLALILENENSKRQLSMIRETIWELTEIQKQPHFQITENARGKLLPILSAVISELQPRLEKSKDLPEAAQVSPVLISTYELLLKMMDHSEAKAKVHFDYAECLVLSKRYLDAVAHFRWVVEQGGSGSVQASLIDQAAFKAISTLYEDFNAKNQIPKTLKAAPIPEKSEKEAPELARWVKWIDDYHGTFGKDSIENFFYEANRVLYSRGQVKLALDRSVVLVRKNVKSKFSIPSASLVVDTYVASQRWNDVVTVSTEFSPLFGKFNKEFEQRLLDVGALARLRIDESLYKAGKFQDVLQNVSLFLKSRPNQDPKFVDLLTLAANAALGLKDKKLANSYFRRIDLNKVGIEVSGAALLTSASIFEDSYDFEKAVGEYRRYLALHRGKKGVSTTELKDISTKTILFAWMSGKPKLLPEVLNDRAVCGEGMAPLCEEYRLWETVQAAPVQKNPEFTKKALMKFKSAKGSTRVVWGLLALDNPRSLRLGEILEILESVADGWSKLDSLHQFALISRCAREVPESLKVAAEVVRTSSPIVLKKEAIRKRVNLIDQLEGTLQKIADGPWARVGALTINQWADLYGEFSSNVQKLPKPKGLSAEELKAYNQTIEELRSPLVKKENELRKKALERATQSGIEPDTFMKIATAGKGAAPSAWVRTALPAIFDPNQVQWLHVSPEWDQAFKQSIRRRTGRSWDSDPGRAQP